MNWEAFYRILPREPIPRRKLYVFLACLFISSVFWLIIKLSQEGQGSYSQPVAITDLPEGLFVSDQSHSFIRYSVRATGARMITTRFFAPTDTFTINAAGLPSMVRDEVTVHYLTYSSIAFRIANRLRPDVELVNVWPDTLFIEMVPAMQKKVNVQLQADVSFARRFNQYGPITIEPDSVYITGPVSLIDTLTFVKTRYFRVEDLNASRRIQVEVEKPYGLGNALLSDNSVGVTIPVEEYTEASIGVDLQVRCPENTNTAGSELVLFPPKVTITYLVALKDYGRADTTDFSAHVVCPDQAALPDRLPVIAERYPPFVIFQNVRPRSVEYLIVK